MGIEVTEVIEGRVQATLLPRSGVGRQRCYRDEVRLLFLLSTTDALVLVVGVLCEFVDCQLCVAQVIATARMLGDLAKSMRLYWAGFGVPATLLLCGLVPDTAGCRQAFFLCYAVMGFAVVDVKSKALGTYFDLAIGSHTTAEDMPVVLCLIYAAACIVFDLWGVSERALIWEPKGS